MKLFDDILKSNGKYDSKKVTMFWSFVMMNIIGIYIVVSDYTLPKGRELNRFVGDVFWGFLGGAFSMAATRVWDKMSQRNKDGQKQGLHGEDEG